MRRCFPRLAAVDPYLGHDHACRASGSFPARITLASLRALRERWRSLDALWGVRLPSARKGSVGPIPCQWLPAQGEGGRPSGGEGL